MTELRVGLVGPGTIGRTHAAAIAEVPGLTLAAVAGGTNTQRDEFSDVASFETTAAMLDAINLDIVAVATPSGLHFEPARLALAAGCHVVVEKPLCVDPAEAARLVGLAADSGKICATISQRRLEPQHLAIKRLLDSGALGRPLLIEADVHWWRSDEYYAEKPWRGEIVQGGGSLFNQGIHSLDLMLFLFGPVRSVVATCATLGHRLAVEDTTASLLAFESGAVGTLVTTTATPPGRPAGLRVFTDRGSCEMAHDEVLHWGFSDIASMPISSGIASGAASPGAIGIAGHVMQWRDVADAIIARRAPMITFADGCDAVRVASAIYRAAAEGRRVALDEFPRVIAPDA